MSDEKHLEFFQNEKHLEFIQNVINRHNANSFMLKGWTVTLITGLFALAGAINDSFAALIALGPVCLFWGLDAFYLSNERCFVDLYNAAAAGSYELPAKKMLKTEFQAGANGNKTGSIKVYNMNFRQFKIWEDNSWVHVLRSRSILGFYLPSLLLVLLVFALFHFRTCCQ